MRKTRTIWNRMYWLAAALVCLGASQPLAGLAQDDLKADAVRRVVSAHDPAIFVATGALYLKQEALRAAGGRPLSAAVLAQVERLIEENVREPGWFVTRWSAVVDRHLSAEEADEVATHFASEGGQLQRRVIELAAGEVLMSNYTFTDRIDYRLAGAESELRGMQAVVDERQFKGVQDFSRYPDAVKFASGGAGVKYMKVVMIQGVETLTQHLEWVARQVRSAVLAGR